MKNAPRKAYRDGISVTELMNMFPTEEHAARWFEDTRWPDGRTCGKCSSGNTRAVKSGKPMPYWCSACRSYFSVRTGTPLACSNIPLRKWAVAIYLCLTSLKSVSSMKLHRDLEIGQKAAWFMLHRIRNAWAESPESPFSGPLEVDETFVGAIERNRHKKDCRDLGTAGMATVVGAKDRPTKQVRAQVVPEVHRHALRTFVRDSVEAGATLYTDKAAASEGECGYDHEAVKYSVGEFVWGMASTNGVESFWSMLQRAHKGTFHKISAKHPQRHMSEIAAERNIRESGTLIQMRDTVARVVGHRLLYRSVIADDGLASLARR